MEHTSPVGQEALRLGGKAPLLELALQTHLMLIGH